MIKFAKSDEAQTKKCMKKKKNKKKHKSPQQKNKIHRDKNDNEFIKIPYFVRGKMKFMKEYVIDGIPADEFKKKMQQIWIST